MSKVYESNFKYCFELENKLCQNDILVMKKTVSESKIDFITIKPSEDGKQIYIIDNKCSVINRGECLLMDYADLDSPDVNYRDAFINNIEKCYNELHIVAEAWNEMGIREFSTLMVRNEIPNFPDILDQIKKLESRLYHSGGPTYDELLSFKEKKELFNDKMKKSLNTKKLMLLYPVVMLFKFIESIVNKIK